jgi:sec-independent protein translocase protein TatB
MSDVGLGEILVIALVGLLVFGPDRLPEMAAQAGRWLRDLRSVVASARADLSASTGIDPSIVADPKRAVLETVWGPGADEASVKRDLGLDGFDGTADAPAPPRSPDRLLDPDAT